MAGTSTTSRTLIDKMTNDELDKFAKFYFDNLMGELDGNNEGDDQGVDKSPWIGTK